MPIDKDSGFGKFVAAEIEGLCGELGIAMVDEIRGADLKNTLLWDEFFKHDKASPGKNLAAIMNNRSYYFVSDDDISIEKDPIGEWTQQYGDADRAEIAEFAKEVIGKWENNSQNHTSNISSPNKNGVSKLGGQAGRDVFL